MKKPISKKSQSRGRAKTKNGGARVPPREVAKRPGGKLGLILKCLEGKRGATIGDLVDATGWQKHSVHGALSRLRTRGFTIRLEAGNGRKAYRLSRTEG